MPAAPNWSRKFDDPIPLPKGRQLVTLKDAASYVIALPKAEHDAEEWQAAMEALRSGSTRAVSHTPSLTERGHGAEASFGCAPEYLFGPKLEVAYFGEAAEGLNNFCPFT